MFSPSPPKATTPPKPRSPSPVQLSPKSEAIQAKNKLLAASLFPEDESQTTSSIKNRRNNPPSSGGFDPDPYDLGNPWSQANQTQYYREQWRPPKADFSLSRKDSASNSGKRPLAVEDEDAIEDWEEEQITLGSLDNLKDLDIEKKKRTRNEKMIQKGGAGKLELSRSTSGNPMREKPLAVKEKPSTPATVDRNSRNGLGLLAPGISSSNKAPQTSSSKAMSLSKLGSRALSMEDTPSNKKSASSKDPEASVSRKRSRQVSSTSTESSSKRKQPASNVIHIGSSDSEGNPSPEKAAPQCDPEDGRIQTNNIRSNAISTPSTKRNAKPGSGESVSLDLITASGSGGSKGKGKGKSSEASRTSLSPNKQKQSKLNFARVPPQKDIQAFASANSSKTKGKGKERQIDRVNSKRDAYEVEDSDDDEIAILSQDPSKRNNQNRAAIQHQQQPPQGEPDEFDFYDDGDAFELEFESHRDFERGAVQDDWEGEEDMNRSPTPPVVIPVISKPMIRISSMDEERRNGYLNQFAVGKPTVGSKASRSNGTTKGKTWGTTWGSDDDEEESSTAKKKRRTSYGARGNFRGKAVRGRGSRGGWRPRGRARGRGKR